MVANGTGLAPFRAFIAERAKISQSGKQVGKMILFFGCRGPKEDYIYREELSEAQGNLGQDTLQIVTAFSRVEGEEKMYVQDRMAETVVLDLRKSALRVGGVDDEDALMELVERL